jgi:hypothetical protein
MISTTLSLLLVDYISRSGFFPGYIIETLRYSQMNVNVMDQIVQRINQSAEAAAVFI